MAESVKVIVRCRPMNSRENGLNCKTCVSCDDKKNIVSIFRPNQSKEKVPPKNFTFDGAYFVDSTTKQIYEDVGFALVDGVLEGYNGTVFAYGQTGCGKSFSMQGIPDPPEQLGIIPRAFEHIFDAIDVDDKDTTYLVQASYLEIYNEEIRDLLGKDVKKKCELRESPDSGVYTQGLTQHIVKNMAQCLKLMEKGWMSRSTGATLMNAESSRSHSIFAIRLEMSTADEDAGEDGVEKIKVGKLNLVDLAGSERQGKTGATGDRLKEATKINLSLSALGNVISALVDGKSKHIPYRDSKLTRLLQDSLGGNTKTMMVACISPADNNYEESMSTLRYANRAKSIKNKPKINEDPKDALLREYAEEIKRLKEMLEGKIPLSLEAAVPAAAQNDESEQIKAEYEAKMAEMNARYEEEKMSKMRLDEELRALRETYNQKLEDAESDMTLAEVQSVPSTTKSTKQTSDIATPAECWRQSQTPVNGTPLRAISPLTIGLSAGTSTSPIASPAADQSVYGEEKQVYDYTPDDDVSDVNAQSMDLQSLSSLTTPVPLTEEAADYTVQLTLSQAESLSVKQLAGLSLNPSQRRILGYEGPVTAAHIACLQLTAAQIMQLDLTGEQKVKLSPYQDAVVATLEAQCEKMAAEQLSSFVTLLKNSKPIKLAVEQAQTLSNKQLASIVLSKDQKKQFGVEEAQALTLEQLSQLGLTPAQVAQINFTDEQREELSDEQYEVLLGISNLLERQELLCILSDANMKNAPTVKLTSEQATQLDPHLVQTMPLTDNQEQIMKEYKDSGIGTEMEVSDIDQLPLLPHQVKHLKISENMPDNLSKQQKKKVTASMETQTKLEDAAVHNISDMEEACTKTVTLSVQEANLLTKEQIAKVHVSVVGSELMEHADANFAEPLTLTPLEIQQMQLTPEQKEQIKAKKMKRIEKHGKIIKKLKKQAASLIELAVPRNSPEPHLTLTAEQAGQVEGSVVPSKEQQESLGIEEGRTLDAEDLGGVVLSRAQISQLDISNKDQEAVLEPGQKEQCLMTNQLNVQQDALKRLQEAAPLEDLELSLTDDQVKTLSTRQVQGMTLTDEQCEALGLMKGQSVSVGEISLITLNGEQVIQLKLSDKQKAIMNVEQQVVLKSVTARAVGELAYLNTTVEEGLLLLTSDQVSVLTEEQLARVILSDVQYAMLGVDKDHVLTSEDLTKISLTPSQVEQLSLNAQQKSFLDQSQKGSIQEAEEHAKKTKTLQDGILPTGKAIANQAVKTEAAKSETVKIEAQKSYAEALTEGKEEEVEERKDSKVAIQLTAEQASILTREQLCNLKLTQTQLDKLGIEQDEVEDLTPSQLAHINFSQAQISSLKLTPAQLQKIPAGLGIRPKTPPVKNDLTKKNSKPPMSRVVEMPLTEAATELAESDKSEAIKMHQAALEKLQQLQSQMMHGSVAEEPEEGVSSLKNNKKKEIKEKMRKRREAAEAKKRKLRKAMEEGDDDGIIEELFSIQMDEVEIRTKKLGKIKDKYKEKVAEIHDLTEEFQVQREDYLESIRDQGKESKLLAQILEQIQPLLRRDCNYYNLDKIKRDCQWNSETEEWFIPPVTISKTKVPALSDLPLNKSPSRSDKMDRSCSDRVRYSEKVSSDTSQRSHPLPATGPPGPQSSFYDAPDDTRIRHKLASTQDSDYFKSKRAQQLLHGNKYNLSNGNGNFSGPSNRLFLEENGRNASRNVLDPIESTYNNDKPSKKKKSSRGRLYPI